MGQTDRDATYAFYDHDGTFWEYVKICPNCGEILCTLHVADEFYGDDIIGCDDCMQDVSVENAPTILIDTDGNRA